MYGLYGHQKTSPCQGLNDACMHACMLANSVIREKRDLAELVFVMAVAACTAHYAMPKLHNEQILVLSGLAIGCGLCGIAAKLINPGTTVGRLILRQH